MHRIWEKVARTFAGTPHNTARDGHWHQKRQVRAYALTCPYGAVVGREGLEPSTLGLKVPCSAN